MIFGILIAMFVGSKPEEKMLVAGIL